MELSFRDKESCGDALMVIYHVAIAEAALGVTLFLIHLGLLIWDVRRYKRRTLSNSIGIWKSKVSKSNSNTSSELVMKQSNTGVSFRSSTPAPNEESRLLNLEGGSTDELRMRQDSEDV